MQDEEEGSWAYRGWDIWPITSYDSEERSRVIPSSYILGTRFHRIGCFCKSASPLAVHGSQVYLISPRNYTVECTTCRQSAAARQPSAVVGSHPAHRPPCFNFQENRNLERVWKHLTLERLAELRIDPALRGLMGHSFSFAEYYLQFLQFDTLVRRL